MTRLTDIPARMDGLLDEPLAPQRANLDHGNDVLGQIFGPEDVSRAVARNASAQTGLGGLASMLDLDGDGNPLDDILQMLGKTMR